MTDRNKFIVVPVSIPCNLEVIPHRHRNPRPRVVWEEGSVAIEIVEPSAAPMAFRVTSARDDGFNYEVLRYRGRLWWPLFDGEQRMSRSAFVKSAENSRGCLLASLNLSPPTLDAPRDCGGFDIDQFVGRISVDSRKERWRLARWAASRFLCCNDMIFVEGAEPAYFGLVGEDGRHRLHVGQLNALANMPGDVWHPGLPLRQRQTALKRSLVMSASEWDVERADIVNSGESVEVLERIEAFNAPSNKRATVTYRADSLGRMVLADAGKIRGLRDELRLYVGSNETKDLMQPSVSREVLWTAVHALPSASFDRCFGFSAERAMKAIREIDRFFPAPSLSPEDDLYLAQLATDSQQMPST